MRGLATGLVVAAGIAHGAAAQDSGWVVTDAVIGECVAECYAPATAWLLDASEIYAFGVQCGGTTVLERASFMGPFVVDEVPEDIALLDQPDIVSVAVDGAEIGRYEISYGLNDTYLVPDDGVEGSTGGFSEATWAPLEAALSGGSEMVIAAPDGRSATFAAAGAAAAFERLAAACAADDARAAAGGDAPRDAWSTASYPDDFGTPYARIAERDGAPITFSTACGSWYWVQGGAIPGPGTTIGFRIDGTDFGAWEVGAAESPEYHFPVRPLDPEIRVSDRFVNALKAGSELVLIWEDAPAYSFTLSGSGKAIGDTEFECH